tara:strand:- start:93 stop:332 length:240 start_codon:yes stop_codon:yes gene_type:complete
MSNSFDHAWAVVKAINPEWMEYYNLLENIRESGIVNMFGAAPHLANIAGIDEGLAKEIHLSWMENYDELMAHPDYRRNG